MRIGPIRDAMAAVRVAESRRTFADAADYVRDHAPAEGVDPVAWAAHGVACREMVAQMDEALAKWERRRDV